MTWFRVDDGFSDHPKVKAIPRARRATACGLWVLAGSWSSAKLTEGHIPEFMIEELGGIPRAAADLVTVGLWVKVDDGYRFHQWEQCNPTRAAVEAERDAAAERQRRAREKARDARAAEQTRHAGVTRDTTRDSRRDDGVSHGTVTAPPTRPDPYQVQNPPIPSGSPPPPSRRRGIRLPDDFEPSAELISWVKANFPDVPRSENDAFVDYWIAIPGAKGEKLDWDAAWRTWMRRCQADIRSGRRSPAGPKRSTTDERVAAGLALAAKYDAEDGTGLATIHQIGGIAQ